MLRFLGQYRENSNFGTADDRMAMRVCDTSNFSKFANKARELCI